LRKITKIVLGIVLLFIVAGMLGSGNKSSSNQDRSQTPATTTPATSDQNTGATPTATPEATPTIYKIGNRVVVGGRAYTVTNVRTASTLGDQYLNVQADGMFVIVDMTIETLEKETTQMMNTDVKIFDSQGRTFEDATKADMYIKNDLFLKQLQPGLPSSGEIAFDVPKGITANLQVSEGGFGTKTELISLGKIQ
jgi:Domain of unknown function (DUF4352)